MPRLLAMLAVVLIAATAAADPDPEAQRLLDEGTRLFSEEADHEAARDAFQRSFRVEPSWRALNGIALTYQEQGRHLEALAMYEQLLRDFDSTLSPTQRTTAQNRIAALEAKLARVDLNVEQPMTTVSIDSDEIGVGPLRTSVRLMPGRHVLVATRERHITSTRTFDLVSGQRLPLSVVLEPERVVVRTAPVRLARPLPRWAPWVTIGSGAVLVAAAGALHIAAGSNFDAFDASVTSASGTPAMAVRGDVEVRERAELQERFALVGVIAGGLALVGGGVLFALNQPRPIDVVPSRRGVAVLVRF